MLAQQLSSSLHVRVIAVDADIPARTLNRKFTERGFRETITPLNLDVTDPLPFAEGYFDAVFCMTSIHYFGLDNGSLGHLLRYLKPGGRFSVGNTCFDREVSSDSVPKIYRTMPPGGIFDSWTAETSRYHSPDWWRKHLEASEIGDILECVELDDGPAMWEDKLAYDLEKSGFDDEIVESSRWKIDQILYGRNHAPRFTFFVASVNKF